MKERLVVALDYTSRADAERMVDILGDAAIFYKVGPALFLPCGASIVEYLKSRGLKVFLDLKFHDIPNTVAKAAEAVADLGVDIFNIHASGGHEMMAKAVQAVQARCAGSKPRPLVLAVTILTSLKQDFLSGVMRSSRTVEEQVLALAELARDAGCDGVVASAWEVGPLKRRCGQDFVVLTPGIRPKGTPGYDQKRMKTPGEAIRTGSDFIVVGRPITEAPNPRETAIEVVKEMEESLE